MTAAQSLTEKNAFIEDFDMSPWVWKEDMSQEEALLFFDAARLKASKQRDYPAILEFKKQKSMLHPDVLILTRALASVMNGPIIEIGAYIGGMTTMIAKGLKNEGKFMSIERGGAYEEHPHLPSSDIFRDLINTMQEQDVMDRVVLHNGVSRTKQTRSEVELFLRNEKIHMLSIDADGNIADDMTVYEDLCAPGCVLIFDDYIDAGFDEKNKKFLRIREYVDEKVSSGHFIPFGVVPWGTWIGRMT